MSAIERIVLVDDNELDNDFHTIVLRKAGYGGELLSFETGPDLLRFLQTAAPDRHTCIFLDINMPIESGFETADQLLPFAQASGGRLQVHILSSSESAADRQRAADRPLIRRYIVKPLTVSVARAILDDPGPGGT